MPFPQPSVALASAGAQQAARALGVPYGSLSLGQHAQAPGDHFPPPQAQACLLLQKTLPMRELRLCFEDPEWEQLTGQILAKVTEVTATGLSFHPPSGVVLSEEGGLPGTKPGGGWGLPQETLGHMGSVRVVQPGHLLLRICRPWGRRRPSRSS